MAAYQKYCFSWNTQSLGPDAYLTIYKAINALFSLKSATPSPLLDEPLGYSPSARPSDLYNVPQSAVLHRGQRFFDQVYGKVSKRVMSQMDRSGTEDLGITARLMYGYILSNTNVLTAGETSFVLVAGLIPQDVERPPLKPTLPVTDRAVRSLRNLKAT